MIINIRKYLLYFLILVYFSGAVGYSFYPDFFKPFTPYTLVFTCLVFISFQNIKEYKYILCFFALALIGYISEVIGVKTGLVFGEYHYGDTLGFKILDVPFVISLNWALLINIGILAGSLINQKPIILSFISASIITVLDLLIEQVASEMEYWHFSAGIAQIHNYLGWFVISFIAALIFQKFMLNGNKKIALLFLSLQVFFFGLIYINKLIKFV